MRGQAILVTAIWCAGLCAGAARAASAQSAEHASADDCAIFVAVGKAQLEWGAAPPKYDFFPQLESEGAYVEDCAWKSLGVAAPVTGSPKSTRGFFFTRPQYSGDSATVEYEISVRPEAAGGRPFLARYACTLTKTGTGWRLRVCEVKEIT